MSGDDDTREAASSVCYADEADAAYMGYARREEIVAFLNVLLEAERAGARVTLETSRAAEAEAQALAASIHRDEAQWCAMLLEALRRYDGVPSPHVGAFYDMAMAITDVPTRLAFLNRGQGWVVRKLREMLPKIRDDRLYGELEAMLRSHERNIETVERSGLAKPK